MKSAVYICLIFCIYGALALKFANFKESPHVDNPDSPSFVINGNHFEKDGQPFTVVSGAMHYFRVLPEQWADRLSKMKLGGLNTVETYVPWNLHQPTQTTFDFEGGLDIVSFIKEAQAQGLLVIVRPGPYICAEWEFGGFPYWLLQETPNDLRCSDPTYLSFVSNYFSQLIPKLAPLQYSNGGPIIMVQVENEYGSYGNDHVYLTYIYDLLHNLGLDSLVYFASNGPNDVMLEGGAISETLRTVNFGMDSPAPQFQTLREFQPTGPLMCTELWVGWFDHWGEQHHTVDPATAASILDQILSLNGSVNMYMYEGGTNFGFMNGANYEGIGTYASTVTSYDYDAPLTEWGDPTTKFIDFKKVISQYISVPSNNPQPSPKAAYGTVQLTQSASLFDPLTLVNLARGPIQSIRPLTFESLDQAYGFVLYRTFLEKFSSASLTVQDVHDRGLVYINGSQVAAVYRETNQSVSLNNVNQNTQLDILVENLGRINYGNWMNDFKGITQGVRLNGQFQFNWTMWSLPLDNVTNVPWERGTDATFPAFFRGTFSVSGEPLDTFILMQGWTKGVVYINGFNLGRYWEIGPQMALYVPYPVLQSGVNEVVIFELEGCQEPQVVFQSTPDL